MLEKVIEPANVVGRDIVMYKIFTMTYVMKNEVYRGRRAKYDNISERIESNLTPEIGNKFQGGKNKLWRL